jgi:hypothetical protein
MRFPNPCGYYRVFGARDGSGFPTAIQRDSVAELGIFPQPARGQFQNGTAGSQHDHNFNVSKILPVTT